MPPRCYPDGPQEASILIVGEAPGVEEIRQGRPFVGVSGQELTRMLHDAGINRTECRITNVTPFQPPRNDISNFFVTKTAAPSYGCPYVAGRYPTQEITEGLAELSLEIARTRPKVIIALGDTALWALTQETGITKWRGSELSLHPAWDGPFDPTIRVIPTYHPAAILRVWEWRSVACYDLSKAGKPAPEEPDWQFQITPDSYEDSRKALEDLLWKLTDGPLRLSCDIETLESKVIDCIGFAWSETEALCIPLIRASDYTPLFTVEEEVDLILLMREILLHPNAHIIGQNFYYDAQYIARLWGFLPVPAFDTMVGHAVAYPGTPKSLDYLSSIYLPWHRYWKGESREAAATADDNLRWRYNCKDGCATWALEEPIRAAICKAGLNGPLHEELTLFRPLIRMMLKGVRQAQHHRGELMSQVMEQQSGIEQFFDQFTEEALEGVELARTKKAAPWYRSPTQQAKLFYEVLRLPVQKHKKTKRPTADDDALTALRMKEPVLLPLLDLLSHYRSLGVFLSTFILVRLDHDLRLRCSYGPVGTETFRFNSSADVFGFGGNLQNIPAGDEK